MTGRGGDEKEAWENLGKLGGHGNAHYLDCGCGFTGVYTNKTNQIVHSNVQPITPPYNC